MSARAALVGLVCLLGLSGADAIAQAGDEASMRALGEKLAMARQGQLENPEPLWLRVWELPPETQRTFKVPKFSMRVAGDDPYVMLGGEIRRPGDKAGGHEILAIEPEGVVLEVDGYPVLVE